MELLDLDAVVDVERYPVTDLEGPQGRALVARCREALAAQAICVLPEFLRDHALARMVREAEAVAPLGHRMDEPRISYEFGEPGDWPPEHPRHRQHDNRYRHVLSCQIPNGNLLRRLFLCPKLTDFVRRALGHDRLYTSACPYLALSLHVAREGDCNGWHFDPNDGVVTLMLQQADSGGHFEYAPYIRSDEDQRYDAVSELFAAPESHARRPAIAPGCFVLFNGRLSMHRVSPIGPTGRPRIMAIFSYDQRPDMVFSQSYIDHVRSFPQDAVTA